MKRKNKNPKKQRTIKNRVCKNGTSKKQSTVETKTSGESMQMLPSLGPKKFAAASLGVALVISLLLLSMSAAGCLSSASDSPKSVSPASPASSPNTLSPGSVSPASQPSSSGSTVNANDSLIADTKTGVEKTQAAIAALVPDGTYESNVTYYHHAGPETVDIQLALKDDVITSASVSGISPNMMSAYYISSFNAALPSLVVGKKIDQLGLPHNVAGSSLTNAAFQQYVAGLIQSHGAATG